MMDALRTYLRRIDHATSLFATTFLVSLCLSFSVQAAAVWFAGSQYAYQVDTDTNSIARSVLVNNAHDLVVQGSVIHDLKSLKCRRG